MNSTDEARIRRFFTRRLAPAAEALRKRNVRFFALGPETGAETYYVDGPRDEPEFTELEEEACERTLQELWEKQGLPELAELAAPLMELSRRLTPPQSETGEISPFVYVMY